jgi:hypothetical protein
MKLRRAIAALGAVFALSFGLMLAPSQADAATVTINPRTNAVEAGQVLAAPDGSVFTITIYNEGLVDGQKSVTHSHVTGNTLRQTANKIVQAINADTDLQGIGVAATLGTGANYTITSTSTNGTVYKQTTTGGGSNRLAIQQTLTIGGTVTVDDKLTLTIYDAGLVSGKEAVVYKPNSGDTLADIVIRLRNKINNSTTLSALGISAKVSSTDPNTLLIESPTFDTTEKFTSYSAVVKAGGTETMTLGTSWGTNGAQTLSIAGSVTVGDVIKFNVTNADLPDLQKEVSYTVQAGDNLNKIRCGLRTAVNNDADLAAIGVHATCAGGVLDLTTTSSQPTAFLNEDLVVCTTVLTSPSQWPAAEKVKYCGTNVSVTNALRMRTTLEEIGANSSTRTAYASDKLKAEGQFTVYLYHSHTDFYKSGQNFPWKFTNGPTLDKVSGVENTWKLPANIGSRHTILGWSTRDLSLIFENAQDSNDPARTEPEIHFSVNHSIQHGTAHEMGHQFSALDGNSATGATFSLAWQRDLEGMGFARSCKYNAHAANTEPPQPLVYDGIFTGALAADRTFVCGGDGNGFGGPNPLVVLGNSYPYFSQFNTKPVNELPREEVFSEWFAWRAGFPDYIASDGSLRNGSNQVFETSQALSCTFVYINDRFDLGQDPASGGGYAYPHSDTQTAFFSCSDGSTTVTDNPGT